MSKPSRPTRNFLKVLKFFRVLCALVTGNCLRNKNAKRVAAPIVLRWERLVERWFGYDFFISYRRAGSSDFARHLHNELKKLKSNIRPFLDETADGFRAGVNLDDETARVINMASVLVVVVDSRLLDPESTHVPKEVAMFSQSSKPIVSIDRDGTLKRIRNHIERLTELPPAQAEMFKTLLENRIALEEREERPSPGLVERLAAVVGTATKLRLRVRLATFLAIVMAVVAAGATTFWLEARRVGRIERGMRCAAQSRLVLEADHRLAVLLAVESARSTGGHRGKISHLAESSLRAAIAHTPGLTMDVSHDLADTHSSPQFSWSADGEGILTSGTDGRLTKWNMGTSWPPSHVDLVDFQHTRGEPFTFSSPKIPHLKILLIDPQFVLLERDPGAGSREVLLLDMTDRKVVPKVIHISDNKVYVIHATLSRTGRWLYIWEGGSTSVLVDMKEPREPIVRALAPRSETFVGFSENERFLVTLSCKPKTLQIRELPATELETISEVVYAKVAGQNLYLWLSDGTFGVRSIGHSNVEMNFVAKVPYSLGGSFIVSEDQTLIVFGHGRIPWIDLAATPSVVRFLFPEGKGYSSPVGLGFGGRMRWLVLRDSNRRVQLLRVESVRTPRGVRIMQLPGTFDSSLPEIVDERWLSVNQGSRGVMLYDLLSDDPTKTGVLFPHILNGAARLSPDGKWLLGSNAGKTLHIWALDSNNLVEFANRLYPEGFTSEEWRDFFPEEPIRNSFDHLVTEGGKPSIILRRLFTQPD